MASVHEPPVDGRTEAKVPDDARCWKCNYPLRSLFESRCPECGLAFEPAERTSYNVGRRMPTWARRWVYDPIKPPSRMGFVAAVMVTLWDAWWPACMREGVAFLGLMYIAFTFRWAARSGIARILERIYRQEFVQQHAGTRVKRMRITFAICAMLVVLDVPFRVAFWMSRSSLERYAHYIHAEMPYDAPWPAPKWCGFYRVRTARLESSGVTLSIWGGGYVIYDANDSEHYMEERIGHSHWFIPWTNHESIVLVRLSSWGEQFFQ